MEEEFFKIEIDGRQFQQAYLVYVVKLKTENNIEYYYIGQTGDRNYITARPAFRRLAAHFSDQGYSTENQIYRQVAFKILGIESASKRITFDIETKNVVSEFLSKCKIEMFVHPIEEFLSIFDLEIHKSKRELTEKIENELLNHFIEKVGKDNILNKKLPKIKTLEFLEVTTKIINHVN